MQVGFSILGDLQKMAYVATAASAVFVCKNLANFNKCQSVSEIFNNSVLAIFNNSKIIISSSIAEYSFKKLNCKGFAFNSQSQEVAWFTLLCSISVFITALRFRVKVQIQIDSRESGDTARVMEASRNFRAIVTQNIQNRDHQSLIHNLEFLEEVEDKLALVGGDQQELNELAAMRQRIGDVLHPPGHLIN